MAVPARPGLSTFIQPDGSELQVCVIGDENGHYCLTEDGYLLVYENDGFYYGEINADGRPVASRLQARRPAQRSAADIEFLNKTDTGRDIQAIGQFLATRQGGEFRGIPSRRSIARGVSSDERPNFGRFPGSHFPCVGEQKAIVILVEYQDVRFSTDDPHDYFSRMLNEEGFDTLGGTGSARDFFIENSNGLFRPEFDLYGPVMLKENMAYYGANDIYGSDVRPHEMVLEACRQLDGEVDFSQYDRDGDGFIDNVFVYYAGRGEATGGSPNSVWPHSWTFSVADPGSVYEFDGVRLESYGCTNEWDVNNGVERPDAIGIFVHEFSHVLGLPDLYNTVDQNATFTPGSWSTLDAGPYNNNSCTPPYYGAFERYALGWMEPEVIDRPATVSLDGISTNRAVLIPTAKAEEYFLLENRRQTGWDTYLPGHGMLIWHVDYDESIWGLNTVNNRSSHPYVDLEEADNVRTNDTRAGDAFPGTAGITSFTDSTQPSMMPWTNRSVDLPITDIAENEDGTVSFLVGGGFVLPDRGVAVAPSEIGHDDFIAMWEPSAHALGYLLSVCCDDDLPLSEWNGRDMGNALEAHITGLDPETAYRYHVTPYNRCGNGEASEILEVITLPFTFDRKTPVALEAEEVTHDSFIARWEGLEEAEAYIVDVYTKNIGTTESELCDFSGGTKSSELPQGWTSTSEASFAMASYAGSAIPSLRLGNDGDQVESPDYGADITAVSFWMRGSSTDDDAEALICGKIDGDWTEIARQPAGKDLAGHIVALESLPEGMTAVRIAFEKEGKGSLAIDDICVVYAKDKTPVPVTAFEVAAQGADMGCRVEGLQPDTRYFYTVRATDGTLFSRLSKEICARTKTGAGVTAAAGAPEVSVAVANGRIEIRNAAGLGVEVTDLSGCVIARHPGAVFLSVEAAASGCYVVRVGGTAYKVMM